MKKNTPVHKKSITVTLHGRKLSSTSPVLLSELLGMETPCGGHGSCGKCKVTARGELSPVSDREKVLLSPAEISRGIRLACLTYAVGDCEITPPASAQSGQILTIGEPRPLAITAPVFANYGVCVDLGTTTLAARLYNTEGKLLATDARLNPQSRFGADVISRIETALGGSANALADAIRNALEEALLSLAQSAQIDVCNVDGAVITGNAVMLSLLTRTSVKPFSHAPFAVDRLFGETLTAGDLGIRVLQKNTPVYLPPCISAFVGADTVCAILATRLCEGVSALLADVGTNGELALWHREKLTVCSTAAGPAFEGVGISMGMCAGEGAIDKTSIVNGAPFVHVIGEGSPVGICGSGLVDAISAMLDLELLDESGYLEEDPFVLCAPVTLTQRDIRMLQLAKSAICAGLLTLTETERVRADDLHALFVAGGFGSYLDLRSAARIGLLPSSLAKKAVIVGNAALDGAARLLFDEALRKIAVKIAASATLLSLADSPIFARLYTEGMLLKPCP